MEPQKVKGRDPREEGRAWGGRQVGLGIWMHAENKPLVGPKEN